MTSLMFNFSRNLTDYKGGGFQSLASRMVQKATEQEHSNAIENLHIELDKALDGSKLYQPGETISGKIWIRAGSPSTVKWMWLHVVGQCRIKVTTEAGKPLEAREKYLDDKVAIISEETGMPIASGIIRVPFEYTLPERVPSSFNGEYGNIVYTMKCSLLEEGHETPVTSTRKFAVLSPHNDNGSRKSNKNHNKNGNKNAGNGPVKKMKSSMLVQGIGFSGRIYAKVKINKRHQVPGTNMMVTAKVWNNSSKTVSSVQGAVNMHCTYKTKGAKSNQSQIVTRKSDNWVLEKGEGRDWNDVPIAIPDYLPDTNLSGCGLIDVSYEFIFSIQTVKKTKKPLEIVIPITLGASNRPKRSKSTGSILDAPVTQDASYGGAGTLGGGSVYDGAGTLGGSENTDSVYGSIDYRDTASTLGTRSVTSGFGSTLNIHEGRKQLGSIRERGGDEDLDDEVWEEEEGAGGPELGEPTEEDRHAAIKRYIEEQRQSLDPKVASHLSTLQAKMVVQAVDKYKGRKPRKGKLLSEADLDVSHQRTIPLPAFDLRKHGKTGKKFLDPYLDAQIRERIVSREDDEDLYSTIKATAEIKEYREEGVPVAELQEQVAKADLDLEDEFPCGDEGETFDNNPNALDHSELRALYTGGYSPRAMSVSSAGRSEHSMSISSGGQSLHSSAYTASSGIPYNEYLDSIQEGDESGRELSPPLSSAAHYGNGGYNNSKLREASPALSSLQESEYDNDDDSREESPELSDVEEDPYNNAKNSRLSNGYADEPATNGSGNPLYDTPRSIYDQNNHAKLPCTDSRLDDDLEDVLGDFQDIQDTYSHHEDAMSAL